MHPSAQQAFYRMAGDGTLAEQLRRCCQRNLPFSTLGGEVFWENLLECHGWRVQRHRMLGNCRIIDNANQRHAWGSLDYLEELLLGHPPTRLSNYHVAGQCFYHYPLIDSPSVRGQVFLLHGLFNRAHNMSFLARKLSVAGFAVANYDYPTCGATIVEHGQTFLQQWRQLLADLPLDARLFFLTHSLGGIVLRVAMQKMTAEECGRITAVVMMAPPNRGSYWPDILAEIMPLVKNIAKPIDDLRTDDTAAVNQIAPPVIIPPIGIIRAKEDWKVTSRQTEIKDVNCEYVSVPGAHWQLPFSQKAVSLTMSFFETGNFTSVANS